MNVRIDAGRIREEMHPGDLLEQLSRRICQLTVYDYNQFKSVCL